MIATMITGDPDPEDLRKYFRALQPRAARHRPAARALHALLQATSSRSASTPAWTRAAGARASASCSSGTAREVIRGSRSPGSPQREHLRGRRDGPRATTIRRRYRWELAEPGRQAITEEDGPLVARCGYFTRALAVAAIVLPPFLHQPHPRRRDTVPHQADHSPDGRTGLDGQTARQCGETLHAPERRRCRGPPRSR